jgi:hypothetical protein
MDIVIKTSNFFHSSFLNHREFGALLEEIKSECGEIIYPSDVTWLILGCFERVFLICSIRSNYSWKRRAETLRN